TPNDPVDPNCVCKDGKHPESGFCPPTPPDQPAPASDGATLDVSIKTKAAMSYTVEGKISKDPDNYTVIWFRKGAVSAVITAADAAKPAPEPTIGLSDVGADTPAEPAPAPPKAIDRASEGKTALADSLDGHLLLTAPRMNQDYEVCGRLIKKSDNSTVDDNKCVKIDKQVAQPGMRNMNPFGPQQMMPTRGGASDAVFRGVR
ncbi:MAG: hypothetical protein ACJ76H_10020, partial [Bacteriovoracaceae bacterium]